MQITNNHVFISYSKKDRVYARGVADQLLALGFEVWIDDRIDFGDEWWGKIVEAIRSAKAFIVIMTDDASVSDWVKREVLLAAKNHIPSFPLWLSGDFDTSVIWSIYVGTQYADVRDGNMPPEGF